MRYTKKVSVWPVGNVGGLKYEGPLCKNGKVIEWRTAWAPDRKFPVDMAAFAVGLKFLLAKKEAKMDPLARPGYIETSFLSTLVSGKDELETKGDCSKVI